MSTSNSTTSPQASADVRPDLRTDTRLHNAAIEAEWDPSTKIAVITLAMPRRNVIDERFGVGLADAVEWAATRPGLAGLILASSHAEFCAGADIEGLWRETDAARLAARVRSLGALFRRIETLGVPVVAELGGTALGGGYELALACHHRVALDDPSIKVGLPEVQLGVMPGAGGTQRLPRLIGIQAALEQILQGASLRVAKAKQLGMVDAIASDREDLRRQSLAFIAANPKCKQPWDEAPAKRRPIPGAQPGSEEARNMIMAAAGMLRKKTAGAYRGPELALSAASEGFGLSVDAGMEIEARYFVELAVGAQAKDMMRTLWFSKNAADKHVGLPALARGEDAGIERVAILGAGMMGAGLGFVCAQAGYRVVVRDIKEAALEAARAHFASEVGKKRHWSPTQREEISARVEFTLDEGALQGTDLVIEAVFENLELKHRVNREIEPKLTEGGIWASNTSALPIGELAASSAHPDRFIGLHYFSPVEVMPLLEIVMGPRTSERTLARCLAFSRKIGKTPIVVNDGYGFYTTRVFSSYILEGAQLVAEGHDPAVIEWAAKQAGMVVGPLQVFDEVTLTLGMKAISEGRRYVDGRLPEEGTRLISRMVEEHQRTGRAAGAGFYEYEGGKRRRIWPGLRDLAQARIAQASVKELSERLLLAQANQAAHCLADGILRTPRDGDVGAVFGLGFAPCTGGPVSWMDRRGATWVVEHLDALASRCGPRFAPPAALRELARTERRYYGPDPV